jgi:C_GCAxxG_C_C family probable redox protein
MTNQVSVEQVRQNAEELFREGRFYCSEAVMASIVENFQLDIPREVIAMASGFPVGIGKSKCVCGAVSGGVMAIGLFFGRTEGSNPKDPLSVNTLTLANELQEYFKTNHKVLCCKILTKGMDMGSGEHKEQCIAFTGEIAAKTAELILNNWDKVRQARKEV